jgi:isocitrate lyase
MNNQPNAGSLQDLIPAAPEGRFDGIRGPSSAEDVVRLRGSFPIAYTLAERGACGSFCTSAPTFIRSVP